MEGKGKHQRKILEAIVHFDSFGKPLLPNMNPDQTILSVLLIFIVFHFTHS